MNPALGHAGIGVLGGGGGTGGTKRAAPTDGKAAKKVKDPNKPKGKLSAFMFFSADQRITLKTEQPGRATVCDVPTC